MNNTEIDFTEFVQARLEDYNYILENHPSIRPHRHRWIMEKMRLDEMVSNKEMKMRLELLFEAERALTSVVNEMCYQLGVMDFVELQEEFRRFRASGKNNRESK